MITEGRMIVREGARYWWVFLLSGIAWLLIAWVVLRMDVTSIAAVGVLLGVVFLVASVNEVGLGSLMSGGWKILHYVMALIFFIGGLWSLVRPIDSFFALASVLGLILIFYGTFEIARAFSSRDVNPYWWIGLVTGILLLLLAFWVSGSDRVYALQQRTYLILFWVGFFALFKGITQIVNAFGIRHAGKVADEALTA
ncbi:MAG TPA: DUF308 domain-containing protein [Actinomycetota bacterium]|nr:DUF308 domain-containing protein [Actinomycetota bacterium]